MATKQMTENVLYFYKGTAWPQYPSLPVKEAMEKGINGEGWTGMGQ